MYMRKTQLRNIMALCLSVFLLVACGTGGDSPKDSFTADTPMEEEMDMANSAESMEDSSSPESATEESEISSEAGQNSYTLQNLFPFEENTQRIYEGTGGEFAGYTEYVDFIQDNRIQLRMNNGGTEIVRVIERKDGELREIFSEPEIYYVENFLTKKPKESRVLLKEPIAVGTSWINSEVETNTITSVDAKVETPLGVFDAVEVSRVSENDGVTYTTTDYYAIDMGLIKTVNSGGGYTFEAVLKIDEKNTSQKKVMNFYYPNIDDDRLFLYRKEITFKTNDIPRNLFLKAYKELPKEGGPVLTTNTQVNYLYLNDDGMVYIDLSKNFIDEMNAGAGYEVLILQSLVNTFGDYYGANRVMMTIEGDPYESGHILLDEFEPLSVNYKSIVNMN